MQTMTMTLNNAIKNFAALTPQILGGDEVVSVTTDEGNIILISEWNFKTLVGQAPKKQRKPGFMKGESEIPPDFDSMFSEEIVKMFYGEDEQT